MLANSDEPCLVRAHFRQCTVSCPRLFMSACLQYELITAGYDQLYITYYSWQNFAGSETATERKHIAIISGGSAII